MNTQFKYEDFQEQGAQICFELEGKKRQGTGEDYVMRSSMMCNAHQIVFGLRWKT